MKISNPLVTRFASTLLVRLTLGVGISVTAIALTSPILPQTASAQTAPGTSNSVQPFPDSSRQNEIDSLSGGVGGSGFSVFDLIHNSRLYNSRDMNEFTTESRENIDNAAAQFRQQQLQRLGNPTSPVTPDTTPQTPSEELTQ